MIGLREMGGKLVRGVEGNVPDVTSLRTSTSLMSLLGMIGMRSAWTAAVPTPTRGNASRRPAGGRKLVLRRFRNG